MDSVEVPQFFVCPISLQIIQDPVTAATGITYDRSSIERWLFSDNNTTCPVTNQPLPRDSDLTPNHTLRRLIQAWCTINAVDRIPTPKAPLDRHAALHLLADLPTNLKLAVSLASDNETNRRALLHAGASYAVLRLLVTTCSTRHYNSDCVDQALNLLNSLRVPEDELKPLVADNYDLVDALITILRHHEWATARAGAIQLLKSVVELAGSALLERLKVELFEQVVAIVHDREKISSQATKAALCVLLRASPWGRNRTKIVEAGAVTVLIELELTGPERRRTELVMGILDQLCSCADGRAQLVGHAAGLAVVAKRILRVSPVADEGAVGVLTSVCNFSATGEVLQEMVRVGAVSKLCFVLQADCAAGVRDKARWVLRLHSGAWKNSACINMYLLTRYP